MDVKGNETTLRKIFETLIRIEKILIKYENKEEPNNPVLKVNE